MSTSQDDKSIADAPIAQARLTLQGLCLSYGTRVILDDVSFEIAPGEVLGILGPNGSGKTSLMRCLTGLLHPARGALKLDHRSIRWGDQQLRAQLGVVFQDPSLDVHLTVRENLMLSAALFCVPQDEARVRVADLLAFIDLQDRCNDLVRTLSGGLRRRLELARSLISKPQILLLDEPTNGLDPVAFEHTWQRLLLLNKQQGLTMLLSTHRADEAERCDKLLVLDRGHVVACDTPQGLLARLHGDRVVVQAEAPEALAAQIFERLDIRAEVHAGEVVIQREDGHMLVPRLVEAFEPGRLQSVALRRTTLADAFFHLTGHALALSKGI